MKGAGAPNETDVVLAFMGFTFQLVGIAGEYNSIYVNIEDIDMYCAAHSMKEIKSDGTIELRCACGG